MYKIIVIKTKPQINSAFNTYSDIYTKSVKDFVSYRTLILTNTLLIYIRYYLNIFINKLLVIYRCLNYYNFKLKLLAIAPSYTHKLGLFLNCFNLRSSYSYTNQYLNYYVSNIQLLCNRTH